MNSPWTKISALEQYTVTKEKATKAENQMKDAEAKMQAGDNTPDTRERYIKAKSEYDAYKPVADQLKTELVLP